jgi:pimeloyl-ACP methyl ester carboxylesterase
MKRLLSKDGTRIAFERSGIGQPLILVDGALCSRSFGPMPKLVPLLEPHFTVYWYDRRGRNDSGATAPYSVAREVEDLEALVNEAHVAALNRRIAANRRSDAVKYFMRDMVGVPAPFVFVMRFMPMWSKLEAVAHTLPYDAALVGDPSLLKRRAATVSVPTLVIGGEKSPAVLREAVQAVGAAVPGAKRRLLAGQTHDVKPQVVAPVLVEYFEAA